MNEVQAILDTFAGVKQSGQVAALATVVNARGSTYRRPGARMLSTASQIVGMISGGCLENDVFAHANQVIHSGQPRVVTYDTTADEDIVWGLGLGCNGVVQVLIERLDVESPLNPLTFLSHCFEHQQPGVLATVFSVTGSAKVKVGERLVRHPDGTMTHNITEPNLTVNLLADVQAVLEQQHSLVKQYQWADGSAEVLVEWVCPPTSLLIFGSGQDAVPVAQLAKAVGWHVTIIDCRANEATPARFSMADQVILTRRDIVHERIPIDANTVAVVMTHNYLDDAELLKMLLPSSARYIGILGPKHRTERLLQTLQAEHVGIDQAQERLHAPIGLDIGAETPEAIALAIVAEIQAVLANRAGGSLKNRKGAIHTRREPLQTVESLSLSL